MKQMKRKMLFLLFLTMCLAQVKGQKVEGISVAFMNESIAFPFTRFAPVHPGLELSMTLKEVHKERSIAYWNVTLGGFHHERLENGLYIKGEYLHQWAFGSVLGLEASGGLGYMHSFYPGEIYVQDRVTGAFDVLNQTGRAHAIGTVGIGISWIKHPRIQPFIRQDLAIESPFANGIPVIAHSFLKFGITYKL